MPTYGSTPTDPYGYGETIDIGPVVGVGDADGSVWRLTSMAPFDFTGDVLENESNEPPPDGWLFAGVELEFILADAPTEPLNASIFTVEILGGATNAVYSEFSDVAACGEPPNDFDDYGEFDEFTSLSVGGLVDGTICITIPLEDFESPDTRVVVSVLSTTLPSDEVAYFG